MSVNLLVFTYNFKFIRIRFSITFDNQILCSISIFPNIFSNMHLFFLIIQRSRIRKWMDIYCGEGWIQIYLLLMKKNLYLDSQDFEEGINWNPNSNFQEQELHLVNCSVHDSQAMESEKKRPSHKNKYINKITLIKPDETISTKKKKPTQSKDGSVQPQQLKKMKNREAAKESRQRKKLYINLIEQQTKMLEKELEHTTKQIENCKIEIHKSTFNNNQLIGTFDTKMVHVFKKIERLLSMEDSDEKDNELNLAIDSLIYRFGATGKERKNNINESYKQVMSITPPNLHRYFQWSAKEKAHLFVTPQTQNSQNQIWFQQFRKMIQSNISDRQAFFEEKREYFEQSLNHIQRSVSRLKSTKNQIQKLCNLLDTLFQQIRQVLTPVQSAKLCKYIEKFKYREQLGFIESQSPQQLGQINPLQNLSKKQEEE